MSFESFTARNHTHYFLKLTQRQADLRKGGIYIYVCFLDLNFYKKSHHEQQWCFIFLFFTLKLLSFFYLFLSCVFRHYLIFLPLSLSLSLSLLQQYKTRAGEKNNRFPVTVGYGLSEGQVDCTYTLACQASKQVEARRNTATHDWEGGKREGKLYEKLNKRETHKQHKSIRKILHGDIRMRESDHDNG